MKNYKWKIVVGILLLLALTNPTQTDFKNFAQLKSGVTKGIVCSRVSYYLVFSIYEYSSDPNRRFIGVFKNFIQISPTEDEIKFLQEEKAIAEKVFRDSVAAAQKAIQDSINIAHIYECPMHPNETSSKAGRCPECGMDLELKNDK